MSNETDNDVSAEGHRSAWDPRWSLQIQCEEESLAAMEEMDDLISRLPLELQVRARASPFPQFHHACSHGDIEMVAAMLEVGAEPDGYPYTYDEMDQPPLVWLAWASDLNSKTKQEVALMLLKAGACIEEGEPRLEALACQDEEFADFLESYSSV
ncbi:ankyrin repeat domain-containing protein [Stenotrophomonas muris]|uniref:ankyrin repeat domain-containing protein n=1 Tax=Stenotrophomonas muris TaxID=2963283 RepID=UPI000C158206